MNSYFLARHAHVCATEDGFVLLDLKSERYLGLPRQVGTQLKRVVRNWPSAGAESHVGDNHDGHDPDKELIADLVSKGLVTTQADVLAVGGLRTRVPVPTSARAEHVSRRVPVRSADVANFLMARSVAAIKLRTCSLERIVQAVHRRKTLKKIDSTMLDTARIDDLVGTYFRVRPFALTARGACLVDSLVLVEFLARYDVFPDWIIGVRTQPFLAHSWVQYEQRVLNDTLENVIAYAPILTV